jgi:hypothetical protein
MRARHSHGASGLASSDAPCQKKRLPNKAKLTSLTWHDGFGLQLNAGVRQTETDVRRLVMLAGLAFTLTSRLSIAAEAHGLYVAPRAVDIDRKVLAIKHSISYYVPEPYPASNTLEFIARRLAETGWRPATRAELPGQWSSHHSGWLELPSQYGSSPGHLWSATWVNARGDQVHYSLGYPSVAESGLRPTYVHVGAWYEDRRAAERTRAEYRQRVDRLSRDRKFKE